MKETTPNQQRLWIFDLCGGGLCLLATIVIYVAAVSPLLQQRRLQMTAADKLGERQQDCSRMNASLLTLKHITIALREQLAESDIQLETAERINGRVAELTRLLSDNTLTVDDMHTGRIAIGKRCDLVPLRISGRGRYGHCARFLHQLRETLPDICLAGLDLEGVPERPGDMGQFRMDLFWFAAPSLNASDT